MADDGLEDFTRTSFRHDGTDHPVWRSGTGPAVVVIAEFPGITPQVAAFARRVRDLGCTVVLPELFGRAGRDGASASAIALVDRRLEVPVDLIGQERPQRLAVAAGERLDDEGGFR